MVGSDTSGVGADRWAVVRVVEIDEPFEAEGQQAKVLIGKHAGE